MSTIKEMEELKTMIESLTDKQQVDILRILDKNSVKLNNNKMGIFVNLTPLSSDIITEIQQKVRFILDRENTLNAVEKQTADYKHALCVEKEDKDKMLVFPTRLE